VELSQWVAAETASMSTANLRSIEKGRSQPTISVFLSLCEAIGVDPRELFNRTLLAMGYPIGYVPVRNLQPTG
jgi:DNA-binding XRE family transcriptional regulator